MFTHVAALTLALTVAVCSPSVATEFWQLGPLQATAPANSPSKDSHPSSTMPPGSITPAPTENSNTMVEGQIRTALSKERRLQHDSVDVAVSDGRVMLDGEVSNHDHRYIAIRIAVDYAGTRTLVDNLRLRGER